MTPEDRIRKADDTFYEMFREFRLFHYINPLNHAEERERFLDFWELGKSYEPQYEYHLLPSSITRWKKKLEAVDLGDTPLEQLYSDTGRELHGTLELAEARGTTDISAKSIRLYGQPDSLLVEEARQILRKSSARDEGVRNIGVKGVVERLRERLRSDRIDGWDVIEDPSCVSLAEVDWPHHKIRVQSGILVHSSMIDRLCHHLIEAHVFRAINGERQPYKAFAIGLAHYLETEEGLALQIEERLGLLTTTARRKYAGRVLAAEMAAKKSFFDIVSELVKFFGVEEAYSLAERSKRGLANTAQPGGFIQDHVFLKGKKRIEPLSGDDLRMLFVGKISVDHLPLVRELVAQHRLLEAAFFPDPFHG